jgi:hypothetical protein
LGDIVKRLRLAADQRKIILGHAEERGRFTAGRLLAVKAVTDCDEGGDGIELELYGAARDRPVYFFVIASSFVTRGLSVLAIPLTGTSTLIRPRAVKTSSQPGRQFLPFLQNFGRGGLLLPCLRNLRTRNVTCSCKSAREEAAAARRRLARCCISVSSAILRFRRCFDLLCHAVARSSPVALRAST